MFNSDNNVGNFHSDVLEAVPETLDSAVKLIEEIKNRAKGCITSSNYPGAIRLYSKGIEICLLHTSIPISSQAILYSNRSMCHEKMSNGDQAISDADLSIQLDSAYNKGYFRKVQGLINRSNKDDLDFARTIVLDCLQKDPDGKDFQKQLCVIDSKISIRGFKVSEEKENNTVFAATTTTSKIERSTTATKSTSNAIENNDNDDLPTSSEKIRGYKLTSDGKKTTFFNNEMDSITKALIGDIAPRLVDSSDISVTDKGTNGSAW